MVLGADAVARLVVAVGVDVPGWAVVRVKVLGLVAHSCPEEPSNILSLSAVEVYHAPHSDCAKDEAAENIPVITLHSVKSTAKKA